MVESPDLEILSSPSRIEHNMTQIETQDVPPPKSNPTNLAPNISTIVAPTTSILTPRPKPQTSQQERTMLDSSEVPHDFSTASDE